MDQAKSFEPMTLPLVMIHGLQEGGEIWHDVCTLLADEFSSFCLDLPWSGRDGYTWGSSRPATEWLHMALRSSPLRPEALVAHSFGVNVVLEYLQRYEIPNLRALVLISPFYHARHEELTWDLFRCMQQNFREIIHLGLQTRLARGHKVAPAVLEAMVEKVINYVGPLGFMETFSLVARTPALHLERIQVPTLVIAGANDPAATPQSAQDLVQGLPDGYLEIIPACHHFCMLEQPEIVSRFIRRFLMLGAGDTVPLQRVV